MLNQYSFEINEKSYLLKRLSHSDLPLTYHIHFFSVYQNIVLRMGLVNGNWSFLDTMKIHFKFGLLEGQLATEILSNEVRIQDFADNRNFTFSP